MTDFWEVVFTPSFIPRLLHVWVASWTVGAALMLQRQRLVPAQEAPRRAGQVEHAGGAARRSSCSRRPTSSCSAPNMAIEVTNEQPLKLASMEGLYESESCARMFVVGWVDETTQTTSGISIPCLLSFLAYQDIHATVQGIDSFAPDPTPPINLVFQVYHFMITMGPALAAIGVLAGLMFLWRRRLFESRFVLSLLVLTVFIGEATITAGWWTAEIGRQPWVVYDVLQDRRRRLAGPDRARRRPVARDVPGALRAAARPVPVPAQPQDPGRSGGARGRRDGADVEPARTRSATCSAGAGGPPTSETSHDPQRRLVLPVHPDHRRLPDPRRLRHGRRHPAPAARPDRHRATHVPQQHRPGLGRQRGLAGARRRRAVRGLPAGLRLAVLGAVPRVRARAAGA